MERDIYQERDRMNFENWLLTIILKCSEKDLNYLKTLVDRFKELLPKKASKFFKEDLEFSLENLCEKKNQVNGLVYYMLCHIIEDKYEECFDEEDIWTYEIIEHINSFTSPDFSFKTPIFEKFEISPKIQEEMVDLMNNFLKM